MKGMQPGFLENTGEMGEIFRTKDWSTCALGPPESWSQRLQGYVDMVLRMPTGAIIFWGPDQIQLYNLGYSDIMGPRHPRYLGAPYRECWPDTYATIYPMMRRVMDQGEIVEVTSALIPVTRYGFTEETYFTFSFVPLRGDRGDIEGFIQFINETTRSVLAERRLATLRALAPRVGGSDARSDAVAAFRANVQDLPFAAIWVQRESGELDAPNLVGIPAVPIALSELAATVRQSGELRLVEQVGELLGHTVLGPWPEPVQSAMLLPLKRAGTDEIRGVIALGISPRLRFDDTYREFLESAARELASNLAFEQENREKARLNLELQKRAEALTELDRAKTAFFSNVSHEFRTPLTLMLGPIEDALSDHDEPLGAHQRQRLQLVERSGARLFKLVNTLLDFSRIEAGRAKARFEQVDLAEVTTGLAGAFRSLVERAGLRLTVDCPKLPEPIWVDREMWEKIVLNLLSNAFKFTFAGEIRVRLAAEAEGRRVVLTVSDTGTGIPAAELPKLFERFHRVEGAKGRSFEGSGIGLALVQELARILGGEVRVASEEGKGTTFFVSLPMGSAHIAPESIKSPHSGRVPVLDKTASSFVREAASWTAEPSGQESAFDVVDSDEESAAKPARGAQSQPRSRILLADDNPDMRDYVQRLLSGRYAVRAVSNGLEALRLIEEEVPDLILTDVMMPGLDGFGLLAAVKRSPRTRLVPVILLSARAGEESRVEGMEAGADDYLVKPFAARELLARVAARIEIARMRARMNADLERLVLERTAQLREANQELESFSYSVSHDLRAPLRHILGFSQLMEKHTRGKLEPKTQGYLKTIAEAAERGGKLVDDLLAFSRMGRADMHRLRIDLNRMVAEVRTELAPDQEGRKVTWKIHRLPEIQGDPALIRLVIKNLLSNALKYTRPRPEAVIELGASERSQDVEVWVKDNGVGFDMRYVDKLFGVFQRLHTSEQFDGTGIGLALVRRIIVRHGGTTAAQGQLDAGATISFTLPRIPPTPA